MKNKIDLDNLKYLFVDFDGTLVDSVPLLYENYQRFMEKYGKEGSLKEFITLMGPTISEFVPVLIAKHDLPNNSEELIKVYTEGLTECYEKNATLMKGAQEFLDYIKTVGIKMALVTSSPYDLIEKSLEKLKIKNYFNIMITGEKVKKTKPDPEIYLLTLKLSGCLPQDVLAIEDSYNGILSALTAHIPTIALKNEHLSTIPESAWLINSWNDLLNQFRVDHAK